MNTFRDIVIGALIALGLGLSLTDPQDWKWIAPLGPYAEQAVWWLDHTRPFSTVICFFFALALFMTRLKF